MKGSSLLPEVHLNNLLGIVPRTAGIGHVDRLEEAKAGNGNQVGHEEVGIKKRKGQRDGHERDEDVPHAGLGILGADLDHRF